MTTSLSDLGIWCHREELEMQKRALVWESGTEEVPGTVLWVTSAHWD